MTYLPIVPVFDARGKDFDLERHCDAMADFPRFEGEIPGSSFVVVAHALNANPGPQQYGVNFNLLWAIVVATP